MEYHGKIVKSYGYDPHTGDFDEKKFPITKEDKQKENIDKDFENFFQALSEYGDYLKELIKKYDIKPPAGNLDKRIAFNIHTVDNDSTNSEQQQHFKFIKVAVDWEYFS